MPLVPDTDIRAYLPTLKLSDGQLASINLLVAGWLRDASGLRDLPTPLPQTHPLYGSAFELIVLTATNPEGLTSVSNGPTTKTFDSDVRKAAILAAVGADGVEASIAHTPRGSFPSPQGWPDPVDAHRPWW